MTNQEEKKYIYSGWRASEITDAIRMGKSNLPPIDPFSDLDPMLPSGEESHDSNSVIAISKEQNGVRNEDDEYCR